MGKTRTKQRQSKREKLRDYTMPVTISRKEFDKRVMESFDSMKGKLKVELRTQLIDELGVLFSKIACKTLAREFKFGKVRLEKFINGFIIDCVGAKEEK